MNERSPGLARVLPLYLACYVLWFAFSAMTLWTMLQLRNALLGLLTVVGPWVIGAIDKFGVLFLGLIAFAWIIYLETYLREGIDKHLLWRRVVRVAAIQVIVLAVAYGLQYMDLLF